MKKSHKRNRIDTTLGELIATISDIALANSDDAKEARELTRLVLMKILKAHLSTVKSLIGLFSGIK